jgi:ABC-type branched-subunit amino acid transport system substrate-binding protein
VEWIDGDDGTSPDVAASTVASHIARGVHVIIGAGASGVSRAVLPATVAAGIILFSPCNTAADLSTIDDRGLYFRTAPSDILQGKALADVIMRDAVQRVALVARDDSYGLGLQDGVRAELERAGVPANEIFIATYPATEEEEVDFASGAESIRDFAPDAVVVIGFGESASVIKALDRTGLRLRG